MYCCHEHATTDQVRANDDVHLRPAQILDDTAGRRVACLGKELAADQDALAARLLHLGDQVVPVGHAGPRLAQQRRLAGHRENRPQRLPAAAGINNPLVGQPLPSQVECALDRCRARLVRANVYQAGAGPQLQVVRRHQLTPSRGRQR